MVMVPKVDVIRFKQKGKAKNKIQFKWTSFCVKQPQPIQITQTFLNAKKEMANKLTLIALNLE